jgi:hypothetical protein
MHSISMLLILDLRGRRSHFGVLISASKAVSGSQFENLAVGSFPPRLAEFSE